MLTVSLWGGVPNGQGGNETLGTPGREVLGEGGGILSLNLFPPSVPTVKKAKFDGPQGKCPQAACLGGGLG